MLGEVGGRPLLFVNHDAMMTVMIWFANCLKLKVKTNCISDLIDRGRLFSFMKHLVSGVCGAH